MNQKTTRQVAWHQKDTLPNTNLFRLFRTPFHDFAISRQERRQLTLLVNFFDLLQLGIGASAHDFDENVFVCPQTLPQHKVSENTIYLLHKNEKCKEFEICKTLGITFQKKFGS